MRSFVPDMLAELGNSAWMGTARAGTGPHGFFNVRATAVASATTSSCHFSSPSLRLRFRRKSLPLELPPHEGLLFHFQIAAIELAPCPAHGALAKQHPLGADCVPATPAVPDCLLANREPQIVTTHVATTNAPLCDQLKHALFALTVAVLMFVGWIKETGSDPLAAPLEQATANVICGLLQRPFEIEAITLHFESHRSACVVRS